MDTLTPTSRRHRFKNGVIAALEICDDRRAQESGVESHLNGGRHHAIDRIAGIVEAAAERINASDLSALEAVCASQALALDAIFNHFARDAAKLKNLSQPTMKMALRAQSQCRATLKTLVALNAPRTAPKKPRNFDEQSIANAIPPA